MKDLRGSVAIVTGASRGLGVEIARALAARGVKLVLAARSAEALDAVAAALAQTGAEALAVPTDVTEPAALDHLVAEALRVFGAIDLLVNNAGMVIPAAYDRLSLEEIEQHIAINLNAPMALTRRVLPHMRARDRGQIVNIASLGGLLGVAWGECYSATKHGLVGFTRALRASLRASGSRVSASVICPGFINTVGMYADRVVAHGPAPLSLGTSSPAAVVKAVVRAIERDRPEVIVSGRPVRLLLAISALSPRMGGWLCYVLKIHRPFEAVAKADDLDSPDGSADPVSTTGRADAGVAPPRRASGTLSSSRAGLDTPGNAATVSSSDSGSSGAALHQQQIGSSKRGERKT